jgi:hypothetical protein
MGLSYMPWLLLKKSNTQPLETNLIQSTSLEMACYVLHNLQELIGMWAQQPLPHKEVIQSNSKCKNLEISISIAHAPKKTSYYKKITLLEFQVFQTMQVDRIIMFDHTPSVHFD